MSPSDVTITIFKCRRCAFYLCERKTSQQDRFKPIQEWGINPSRQSETRSNDGENLIRAAESGLDNKTKSNNDYRHRKVSILTQ